MTVIRHAPLNHSGTRTSRSARPKIVSAARACSVMTRTHLEVLRVPDDSLARRCIDAHPRGGAELVVSFRVLAHRTSPSSRGLGRGPFKAKTRVRIPLGTIPRFARNSSTNGLPVCGPVLRTWPAAPNPVGAPEGSAEPSQRAHADCRVDNAASA